MDCDSINENDYMASGLPERFEGIKGVLFDYGGTLDSGGDHWSEVIWRAWQEAGVTELADVGKDLFREAYVYAERELARVRHIMPEDDFYQLLRKKMRIEFEWLASCSGFPSGRIGEWRRLRPVYAMTRRAGVWPRPVRYWNFLPRDTLWHSFPTSMAMWSLCCRHMVCVITSEK